LDADGEKSLVGAIDCRENRDGTIKMRVRSIEIDHVTSSGFTVAIPKGFLQHFDSLSSCAVTWIDDFRVDLCELLDGETDSLVVSPC